QGPADEALLSLFADAERMAPAVAQHIERTVNGPGQGAGQGTHGRADVAFLDHAGKGDEAAAKAAVHHTALDGVIAANAPSLATEAVAVRGGNAAFCK